MRGLFRSSFSHLLRNKIVSQQAWRNLTYNPRYQFSEHIQTQVKSAHEKLKSLWTPQFAEHAAVQFRISEENIVEVSKESIVGDGIVTAFFRKFSGVRVFRHKKRDSTPLPQARSEANHSHQTNSPRNCWYQIQLPFSQESELRLRFSRHYSDSLRVSKLLEVLDHVATQVAIDYCYHDDTLAISTISVDHMHFYNTMNAAEDLVIVAYPTFQEGAHIEVQIDLKQADKITGELQLMSCASFLLQARNKHTGFECTNIPKINFDNEENPERSKSRFLIAQQNNADRKNRTEKSWQETIPRAGEIEEIHSMFLREENQEQSISGTDVNNNNNHQEIVGSSSMIPMSRTLEQKTLLMQSQERNNEGQIYIGHLMKESIDLAWIAAYNLVNTTERHHVFPQISYIDDFRFMRAVEVSNIIRFEAQVVYVHDNFIVIAVTCLKLQTRTTSDVTNHSFMVFSVNDSQTEQEESKNNKVNDSNCHSADSQGISSQKQYQPLIPPKVYPNTYKESLLYLDAKRRFNSILSKAN